MNISRRDFLRMAAYAAAAAGVTQFDMLKLNEALAAPGGTGKPPVLWFEGLGDQGCVVSAANYFNGSAGIESVLLTNIELRYNSVLMGACGDQAIAQANSVYNGAPVPPATGVNPNTMPPAYILIVTGAIANLDGYCIVGEDNTGKYQMVSYVNQLMGRAKWVIFAGACACYGGVNMIGGNQFQNIPEALPPTHNASSSYGGGVTRLPNYRQARSIFIPGCPVHPDWLILSIVHLLTAGGSNPKTSMVVDGYQRPTVILGSPALFNATVHSQCPRKGAHDAGNFATSVGDPDKCLESVGCRGKETYADCPSRGWNTTGTLGTGKWCNAKGINHLCIGCSQPMFPAVPFNRQINNITFP